MSTNAIDLARAHHAELLVEAEACQQVRRDAAARRWQRRAVRLQHRAARAATRADRAASRARLALARAL